MGAHAPSTSCSAPSAPLRRSQIITENIKGSPLPGPASLLHSWLPPALLHGEGALCNGHDTCIKSPGIGYNILGYTIQVG